MAVGSKKSHDGVRMCIIYVEIFRVRVISTNLLRLLLLQLSSGYFIIERRDCHIPLATCRLTINNTHKQAKNTFQRNTLLVYITLLV